MLEFLFSKVGWAWATADPGFCLPRPPRPGESADPGPALTIADRVLPDLRIFRQPAFVLVTIAAYFLEWGLFVPVTYLTSYSLDSGAMSLTFAFQIIAIYNAASSVGRWASGFLADRFGRYDIMIVTVFFCMSRALGLWLPATAFSEPDSHRTAKFGLTVSSSVLTGMASGSKISLAPVCVGVLCGTREYGKYYAMCHTIVAFGTLTGVPIAGVITGANGGAYWGVAIFTAVCYFCALACFVAIRIAKVGWRWDAIY